MIRSCVDVVHLRKKGGCYCFLQFSVWFGEKTTSLLRVTVRKRVRKYTFLSLVCVCVWEIDENMDSIRESIQHKSCMKLTLPQRLEIVKLLVLSLTRPKRKKSQSSKMRLQKRFTRFNLTEGGLFDLSLLIVQTPGFLQRSLILLCSAHCFSKRLRPGNWQGHERRLIFVFLSYFCGELAMCFASL